MQEGSADQAGFSFLKKSGKSLCGIISFLELLEEMQVYYQKTAYTQSHPLTRERIRDAKYAAKDENCENINNNKLNKIKPIEFGINERYKFIQAKLIGFNDPENTIKSIKNNIVLFSKGYTRSQIEKSIKTLGKIERKQKTSTSNDESDLIHFLYDAIG